MRFAPELGLQPDVGQTMCRVPNMCYLRQMLNLIAGAVLGFLFSLLANAITGPLLSLASRRRIVTLLTRLPFVRDRRFGGDWDVTWTVSSPGYPETNIGTTEIDSCLGLLAFSTTSKGYGSAREYHYVGYFKGGVVSGRWYDPGPEAYHGMFQIRWNGTCTAAQGKWIGWASDGSVKAGDLRLSRRMDVGPNAISVAERAQQH